MYIRKFNEIQLRGKLLIIYFIGFLIPVLLVNSIFFYRVMNTASETDIYEFQIKMQKTAERINSRISRSIDTISHIYVDREIYKLLEKKYSSGFVYVNEVQQHILDFNKYSSENYRIYTDNPTLGSVGFVRSLNRVNKSLQWYRDYSQKPRELHFHWNRQNPTTVSIIRQLDFYLNLSNIQKILKQDISIKNFQDDMNTYRTNEHFYLIYDDGKIAAKYDDGIVVAKSSGAPDNPQNLENFEVRAIALDKHKSMKGWYLTGYRPNIPYYKKFSSNDFLIFSVIILIFILGTAAIFKLSRSFYLRINHLAKRMDKIQQKNFEPITDFHGGNDEISTLVESYNSMVEQIRELINEIADSQLREKNLEIVKNKAQFRALLSQINPHYLFNVLESIRMKSIIKGEKETATIIKHLSRSFRHLISWEENLITIEEELEISEDFLIVQKYRFGEKLNYEFIIEEDAKKHLIPKMTLQPFIENSCIHGIESISDMGMIHIHIKKEKDYLRCVIDDNGIGISEESLKQIKDSMNAINMDNNNIGFSNTYWRLKSYYPHMVFDLNTSEKGTKVSIKIPLKEESHV